MKKEKFEPIKFSADYPRLFRLFVYIRSFQSNAFTNIVIWDVLFELYPQLKASTIAGKRFCFDYATGIIDINKK